MRSANFDVERETPLEVVLRDIGPWDRFPTITNNAEEVVAELGGRIAGKRLFYYDSEGDLDEIIHENGEFKGFKSGYYSE